jgi:hypothetical protein
MTNQTENTKEVILPFGNNLKELIIASNLSDDELRFLLQRKGIFQRISDKAHTVPLLSTLLLSPKEFHILKEKRSNKEATVKASNSFLEWKGLDKDLRTILKEDELKALVLTHINDNEPIALKYFNVDYTNNEVIIHGKATRTEWLKDVLSQQSEHDFRIIVSKSSDKKTLNFRTESTIEELKTLNTNIQKSIEKKLKEDKLVDPKKTINFVYAHYFTKHKYRYEYLNKFLQSSFDKIEFIKLTNFESGINKKATLPEKFKWLNDQEISAMQLVGNNLQEADIFKLGAADNLVFGLFECEYSFNVDNAIGTCKITFGFPKYYDNRNKKVEFTVIVEAVNFTYNKKDLAKEQVKSEIRNEFIKYKHQIFQEFIDSEKVITQKVKKGQFELEHQF